MFKLTSSGEDKAQDADMKHNLEDKVVAFMYLVAKPVELEEIQDEIRLSDEKTVQLLTRMTNENLVEEI